MQIVVLRGAITVTENTSESILNNTTLLLQTLLTAHEIAIEDILQITFTATKDLDTIYPAVAARQLGITQAALMCTQEMAVVGALEKCIRIATWIQTEKFTQQMVKHQYLKGAACLRPDLQRS